MAKITEYSKSSNIMEINITFGNEQYVFNLHEELIVDENRINREIKEQPSAYSFLCMLHQKLIKKAKDAEREKDKAYALVYLKYKEKTNNLTGRIYDKEYVHQIAIANPDYQKKLKIFNQLSHEVGILYTCVKGFEQRKDLIQTLSANLRKES